MDQLDADALASIADECDLSTLHMLVRTCKHIRNALSLQLSRRLLMQRALDKQMVHFYTNYRVHSIPVHPLFNGRTCVCIFVKMNRDVVLLDYIVGCKAFLHPSMPHMCSCVSAVSHYLDTRKWKIHLPNGMVHHGERILIQETSPGESVSMRSVCRDTHIARAAVQALDRMRNLARISS